jgi:peptide/nickel transport system substrate-binding protein
LSFELLNRNVDQPYKYNGAWVIDEWSKIGLHVTQRVAPTGPWFEAMRAGKFDVVLAGNCQSVVNPLLDVQRYLPTYAANYGQFADQPEIDVYDKMLRETDFARQRAFDARIRETRAR